MINHHLQKFDIIWNSLSFRKQISWSCYLTGRAFDGLHHSIETIFIQIYMKMKCHKHFYQMALLHFLVQVCIMKSRWNLWRSEFLDIFRKNVIQNNAFFANAWNNILWKSFYVLFDQTYLCINKWCSLDYLLNYVW